MSSKLTNLDFATLTILAKSVAAAQKANRSATEAGSYNVDEQVTIDVAGSINVGEDYEQEIVLKADPFTMLAVALSHLNGVTIESIANEGGAAQAFVEAQKIATYTLTPGAPAPVATPTPEPGATATPDPDATATPEPEEEEEGGLPGLPSVGDSSVPLMAQVALIVSLLTLGTGGILFIRTRRSRTSA